MQSSVELHAAWPGTRGVGALARVVTVICNVNSEADRFDLARPLLEHAATSDWVAAGLSMDMGYADRAKAALADHGSK